MPLLAFLLIWHTEEGSSTYLQLLTQERPCPTVAERDAKTVRYSCHYSVLQQIQPKMADINRSSCSSPKTLRFKSCLCNTLNWDWNDTWCLEQHSVVIVPFHSLKAARIASRWSKESCFSTGSSGSGALHVSSMPNQSLDMKSDSIKPVRMCLLGSKDPLDDANMLSKLGSHTRLGTFYTKHE